MSGEPEAICLRLHPRDNVVVALQPVGAGWVVRTEAGEVRARQEIKPGHKLAIRPIKKGESVVKYGCPIGRATRDIDPGEWVHEHNLATALEERADREFVYRPKPADPRREEEHEEAAAVFAGYRRPDGRVGTRNEVWILPTVSCVNTTARRLAERAQPLLTRFPAVDGVYAFPHALECSQGRPDQEPLRRLLANLINHPNAGGVLVLSLGCEVNHPDALRPYLGRYDPRRVKFLVTQEVADELEAGLRLVEELLKYAGHCSREPVPARELKVGLKCGGSDAFSGLTANPLVGRVADRLVGAGGTAVLTELPELFGAETFLLDRAQDLEVFEALRRTIAAFHRYFRQRGLPIYGKDNPSPGNKEGGITTLEEKALGGLHKAGSAPVTGVLGYGDRLERPGLNLLGAVPDDLTSITALAACGCQLVLFTTGRGTPVGTCVPTIKISSRSELFASKPGWIDFDAGRLAGGAPLAALADELWELVLAVASGKKTRAEEGGYREVAFPQDWPEAVT
ncbi:MAG: UxaA family hydrolase [Moorellales bacterium]